MTLILLSQAITSMMVTSKNIEPNDDSDDKVENNFKRVAAETEISCNEPRPGVL